jgi:membrane protein YqaA with SNARE-associated domain
MEENLPPPNEETPPVKKNIVRHLYDWMFSCIRRLYNWVLSWADTRYGTPALFGIAFMESSFFPVPPDVLQIALSAAKPKRAFWYATVTLAGSVLGAFLGYLIGYAFWAATQNFFFNYVLPESTFRDVESFYQQYDFWAVLIFAPTPIPYKIFTIAAGVCNLALLPFFFASVIGRGARFYLVAAIMYIYGPTITHWIDKYFNILTVVFTILLVGGFVALKWIVR